VCQSRLAPVTNVLELDAASNNGVAEIRDVIESAALSSPGRHRVFILDEVHMLSRGAEAALLKTLEEPPEHVVFVLATTDPQKVSETIRSRVQHLQFHLLSVADLDEYVRWVITDAGLDVRDDVIERVLTQGAGSARDTLSALELAVAGGGSLDEPVSIDEVLEALIARDQARGIAAIAFAVQQGRDPRTLADDIVRTLRDCFLSLMAPELVQLPQQRADIIGEHAKNLGAARVVRAMEVIGQTLVEMRHAPDARLLLEVAIVRLSSPAFDDSNDSILVRLQQLETEVRELRNRPTVTLPARTRRPEYRSCKGWRSSCCRFSNRFHSTTTCKRGHQRRTNRGRPRGSWYLYPRRPMHRLLRRVRQQQRALRKCGHKLLLG